LENFPFSLAPILQELKTYHLTLKLNTHVPTTTGIPPHITHLHNITAIKGCCKDIKAAILEFKGELRETVSQAVDDKGKESGDINALILDSLIQALEHRSVNCLEQIGTAPQLNTRVEVNHFDASAAPIVAKTHEFFTRVSIGVCVCIWHSCVTLLQLVTCCISTHIQYNSGVIYSILDLYSWHDLMRLMFNLPTQLPLSI
jgi:hypothetical protein